MNEKEKAVFRDLEAKYVDENISYLQKKVAKKNGLNEEGLRNAISLSFDDFIKYEDTTEISLSKFKKKLDWYMRRSVFYYINEPLIYTVTRRFGNLQLNEDDKFAAARTGFMIALNEFDPSKGFQFSTYAWKIMSNEIIAANKRRNKTQVVKQQSRDIYCNDNGIVFNIEESRSSRTIMVKGEKILPYDIHVLFNNGTNKVYEYIYDSPKDEVFIGAEVKTGQILGRTSGVETEIASMDWMTNNDDHGDLVFNNPLSNKNVDDVQPDNEVNRNYLLKAIYDSIDRLSKDEQLVITKRFLSQKKVNRASVAKELQITEYAASKIEKEALVRLKELLSEVGIDAGDSLFV